MRLRFPVKVCCAVTINNAQEQSLNLADADLRFDCLSMASCMSCAPDSDHLTTRSSPSVQKKKKRCHYLLFCCTKISIFAFPSKPFFLLYLPLSFFSSPFYQTIHYSTSQKCPFFLSILSYILLNYHIFRYTLFTP